MNHSFTLLSFALLLTTLRPATAPIQADDLRALDGEWVFVEDRTEGRTLEQLTPPMDSKFTFRVEDGAMVLVRGHGGVRREVKVTLDGKDTELPGSAEGEVVRFRGSWKDGAFAYEVDYTRANGSPGARIRRNFKMTNEGLIVRSNLGSSGTEYASTGLYRRPQDIPLPTPAKAAINDIAWLAGVWTGTRGTNGAISFEERWSPPKGGSMMATSRTISRDKLSAFEYLRILERDGGLVYIAQPGGAPPTEFVLTEISSTRAVFDNPRHDYPKRIVYERMGDNGLTATIGFLKGGTPRRFEFKRESN